MAKIVSLQEIYGKGYADFIKSKKRYRMVKGGRGSKKSTTTAIQTIVDTMKYPGLNTLVVRRVFKDHHDSTYAQLNWAIARLGVRAYWKSKLSPLEIIYLPTGQKILFRGLDDPMSITSMTVDVGYLCRVWFEEIYQITNENDFDMVDMSVRGEMPDPLFKQITGTFNPWNEKHWLKKKFFDNPDEDTYAITTNYKCNEFLDEHDKHLFEKMKKNNPRKYNVAGLGNWGISEGLVFDNWEVVDFNYQEIIQQRPHIKSAFGLDFGYTVDPAGFICALFDLEKKEIFIYDEHYKTGMLNTHIADMIKYKGYAKEKIIADSSEPKSIEEIRRLGVSRIVGARKGKDSVNNGIQFLQQFKIYIHPTCTNSELEFSNYIWKVGRDGVAKNEPEDSFNHLIDPLRYSAEQFQTAPGKAEVNVY